MAKETKVDEFLRAEDIPILRKMWQYIKSLLTRIPDFTGKLEINFKDGKLMDINETKRTKF